ncbi:hypothetical protein ACQ86N_31975 [Puia sp. P3]|uniref:hypothetical protein n=1 Tax=Puia sp. P3 TaxID=3423952 RepID=UPI003D67929A
MKFKLACCPRFHYGKEKHRIKQNKEKEIVFHASGRSGIAVRLQASVPLEVQGSDAMAEFTLKAGRRRIL